MTRTKAKAVLVAAMLGPAIGCSDEQTGSTCQVAASASCGDQSMFCNSAGTCQQCPAGSLNCDGDNGNLCERHAVDCVAATKDPTTAAEFCSAFAALRCEGIMKCCADAARKPPSVERCTSDYLTACQQSLASATPSCVAFQATLAKQKLDVMKADMAACTPPSVYAPTIAVYQGVLGPGVSCTKNPLFSCCAPGYFCPEQGDVVKCTAELTEGSSCGVGDACANGNCNINDNPGDPSKWVCVTEPLKANGVSCQGGHECISGYCSPTSVCGSDADYYCIQAGQ